DSSNISPYQSYGVLNEHESGVFVTELSRTWKNSKEHLNVMDTTEVTMETKNFPSIGDPSGHLPYVGGLDEHVTIDELSCEAQYLDLSGNEGAIMGVNRACKKQHTLRSGRSRFHTNGSGSSGGFVSINKSSGAGPSVVAGATPGILYVA
ncbi:hypothetical protein Tco_0141754, partial [Tanacetum coccineum]